MSQTAFMRSLATLSLLLSACTSAPDAGVTAVTPGGFIPVTSFDTGGGGAAADAGEVDAAPTTDVAVAGPDAASPDAGTVTPDSGCDPGTCETAGAQCGKVGDGCGGALDCGACPFGLVCGASVANRCGPPVCEPAQCAEGACGTMDDGCEGTLECGACPPGQACGPTVPNRCECVKATCETAGVQCGQISDGCDGTLECGGCPTGAPCLANACACVPQCAGKTCGDDGCGGSCGSCGGGQACTSGQCVSALCSGKCGSQNEQSCGQGCKCYCDQACFQYGDCCDDVCATCGASFPNNCCTPKCDGKQCGDDGCGGSCGKCTAGFECTDSTCTKCTPSCEGKQCGDDGCGGSCGTCAGGLTCDPAGQCAACVPSCAGKVCGDDGCGGSCGECTVDCANLPTGPFKLNKLSGPMASEDLAFDADGNVVGSNDKAIFKSKYGSSPQVFVPNINFRAGLRYLPSGDLMVNKDTTGQLIRITPDGTQNVVLSNLAYPNGMAIDQEGFAWVTEHDANRVLKVDPYANKSTVISQGTIKNPNGICFNADYSKVFVAGFSGVGTIYMFPILPDGSVGKVVEWAKNVGTGWLDGIGIDVCGNLYIADYYATKIYRFLPDGSSYKTVVDGSGGGNIYLPNMQWGSGIGGWALDKLYLPDGWNKGVFEVNVSVPGPPAVYP